ncbi:unnamed protein product [Haemonchus placei]|uniref:ZP domain-containing protein n=1 Tax=Haemonchus placei TaxID=6290 RepID=A0A0N4WVT6_HAEPC|nr:unnamed protein product [Haemonchus placei]
MRMWHTFQTSPVPIKEPRRDGMLGGPIDTDHICRTTLGFLFFQIQRVTCRANRPDADTYVQLQFNNGVGGFVKEGDQVVDIECTNKGHWHNYHSIVTESLTCLST